jgi:hypothetical protein
MNIYLVTRALSALEFSGIHMGGSFQFPLSNERNYI